MSIQLFLACVVVYRLQLFASVWWLAWTWWQLSEWKLSFSRRMVCHYCHVCEHEHSQLLSFSPFSTLFSFPLQSRSFTDASPRVSSDNRSQDFERSSCVETSLVDSPPALKFWNSEFKLSAGTPSHGRRRETHLMNSQGKGAGFVYNSYDLD